MGAAGSTVAKRHEKIDKGTQSPLLKIFREIMTKEKDDPEKRILLNVHREENTKKRRQYSGSRNKIDRRSCDSSCSEHRKRSASYKISSTEQRPDIQDKSRTSSMIRSRIWSIFAKPDADCMNSNGAPPPKAADDSCSCVSCALKKIVSSEYACIGCLLLLFTISIIVAFLVVFKNVPNIGGECKEMGGKKCRHDTVTIGSSTPCRECKDYGVPDSERLKRKIDMLTSKRMKKGLVGDEFQNSINKDYNDVLSGIGFPGMSELAEFGPSFRELSSIEDSDHNVPFHDMDLSTALYSNNNMDPQSSEKLREFYKKLSETDAKIKSLKKLKRDDMSYSGEHIKQSPERSRRSLKLYHYPKRFHPFRQRRSLLTKNQKVKERPGLLNTNLGKKPRRRRFGEDSEDPTGFIIEKKKLLVQYKPGSKQRIPVKKCQHAPKDSHTHEKQMMHPFYKNTQKLDELLDKFLNKNLPEIMSDPFGLDEFFKQDKATKQCKHTKPHKSVNILNPGDTRIDQIPKPKFKFKSPKIEPNSISSNQKDLNSIYKMLKPESTTKYEKDFFDHELKMISDERKKLLTASPSDFEVMLSVSTIMNPDFRGTSKMPYPVIKFPKMLMTEKSPKMRKLMQLEAGEEEEALGYEDFKEVLTDDIESHDEMDKPGDRNRRDSVPKFKSFNSAYNQVQNPNWKGAMPLYPDEINSMMTNKDATKEDLPKSTNQNQEDSLAYDYQLGGLSDTEYMEDYLEGKYAKLVQQAQAYSDYGVLDGKKESRNEKDLPTVDSVPNHKIKLTADNNKVAVYGKIKGGRVPRAPRNANRIRRSSNEVEERLEDDLLELPKIELSTAAQNGMQPNTFISEGTEDGIKIELKPTTKAREDTESTADLLKMISKHIKIKPLIKKSSASYTPAYVFPSTLMSSPFPQDYTYNVDLSNMSIDDTTVFKNTQDFENGRYFLYAKTRAKRRLLATNSLDSSHDYRNDQASPEHRRDSNYRNWSSIDKFVLDLQLKPNATNQKLIKNYIENVKSRNIKIFSTPHAYNSFHYTDKITGDKPSTLASPVIEETIEPDDSVVTISKSEVRANHFSGNNVFGKILLTVKDPSFDEQQFKVIFDVPLVSNLKEDLLLLENSALPPYDYGNFEQFTELLEVTTDLNSYIDNEELHQQTPKRHKRDANMTATWIDKSSTETYAIQDDTLANNKRYLLQPVKPTTIELEPTVTLAANINENNYNDYIDLKSFIPIIPVNISKTNDEDSKSFNYPANSSKLVRRSATSNDNVTLSDFFSLISNWFKNLDEGFIDQARNVSGSALSDTVLLINNMSSPTKSSSTTTTIIYPSTTTSPEPVYPMYDADMIENIGHRSRVLLSVEDNVANVTEGSNVSNNTSVTNLTSSGLAANGNVINSTNPTTFETAVRNVTTVKNNSGKETNQPKLKDVKQKTKAIVKRHADDSNLIFWNDIYDDEYGIQPDKTDTYLKDKIDNSVRDKHSVKDNDFIKRSGRWVQNKFKIFTKNLKKNPRSGSVVNHPESVPSVPSEEKPSILLEGAPRVLSDGAPSVLSEGVPSVLTERAPSVLSERAPSVLSERAPSVQSEGVPSVLSEKVPSVLSDGVSSVPSKELLSVQLVDVSSVQPDNPAIKKRILRSNSYGSGQLPYDRLDYHISKKETEDKDEIEEEYPDLDQKSLFAALNLNMKEVCKKAAKAVQQSKDNCPDNQSKNNGQKVEAVKQEGTIASALMQQLVRLLTDLVDYQVQQKTCAKLSPDLQQFLDWLINSKDETEQEPEKDSEVLYKTSSEDDEDLIDELQAKQEANSLLGNDLEGHKSEQAVTRARYVDCLQGVQDLIEQYGDMTVDEKSKMLGVKPYLDKQIGFLKRQISAYDLYQFLGNHKMIRNKRHQANKKRTRRGNLRRFLKHFGKRTRTTAGHGEAQITNIINKNTVINGKRTKSIPYEGNKRLVKRNLKDVYYRAVAEAKKYSTFKNIHKKVEVTHSETSTVRLK